MKKILLLTLTFAMLLLFTQCSKEDKDFNANFYTSDSIGKVALYIDDVYKGELSYMPVAPQCGATYGDAAAPLSMTLKSGKYRVVGKNKIGTVISSSVMTLSAKKIGSSGSIGGMSINSNDNCLAVGVFK